MRRNDDYVNSLGSQASYGSRQVFEERYDLVLPRENERTLMPMLEYIQTADFRNSLKSLTGYSSAHSGEQIIL